MNNSNRTKKKIAILGSGVGSLSTAFELTDFPGWDELYEITIYQPGWRSGGKTASSRGKNNRIQERGIHILQGWYWNMFRFVRRSYDARRDQGIAPGMKFQNWNDALVKDDTTLLTTEKKDGSWESWPFIFPEDDLIPGDAGSIDRGVMLRRILGIVFQLFFGSPYKKRKGLFAFIPNFLFRKTMKSYPIDGNTVSEVPGPKYGKDPIANASLCVKDISSNLEDRSSLSLGRIAYIILCLLVWPIFWIYLILKFILYPLLLFWTQLKRLFVTFEWGLVSTKGALRDCYSFKDKKLIFGTINDKDYRAWLKKHGGSQMMIRCGLVKFMYYGSFANLKGDAQGILAADMALRIVLDTILYKGSLVWKTRAGTGGTLIAPPYQVLKSRGVKFKYFHRVDNIRNSDSGMIEEIVVAEQVKLADKVVEYQPLMVYNDLVDWPDAPIMDQIDPEWAAKIKETKVDLESSWTDWKDYKVHVMKRGVDFDQIVLGIPVAALKDICSEIVHKNNDWKNMVNKVPTTQTFGAQLWIKPTIEQMGFYGPDWGLRTTDEPNSVNYANLLYSWTDMKLILEEEDWPEDKIPGDLAYFCGTMSDASDPLPPYSDTQFPTLQHKRVMDFSEDWMQKYMGWLFPKAVPEGNPRGFDFNLLSDPENSVKPPSANELFRKQYFCANIDPSNRYTLAWPGTNKYRRKSHETGFSNLFFTGDWTNFGLNVGHMEGTCISGIRAALTVLGTYTGENK
jgi:uncharacterized protein with NAD-binding domain and iron-sulfur cluster